VKLLLDEQISGKVAERLRGEGHDALAVTADPSLRGLSDPDLFEVAQQQGRTVVTYNRDDFEAIIREYAADSRDHHGLVIVHPTRFPSRELTRLAKALATLADTLQPSRSFTLWLQEPGTTRRTRRR
jgi:predicted nuclease of predicted toxin-antitoxin system